MKEEYIDKAIAFAFYKNNELIGYRLDTVGSIRLDPPKIYHYSKEQVEIVLNNINHNVISPEGFGELLKKINGDAPIVKMVANTEQEMYDMLQDQRAFEVRVVKAPEYPREFNVKLAKEIISWEYPITEVRTWMEHPEDHEVIETYYFGVMGRLTAN